jgi:succinate-acetate transporter protein
MEAAHLPREADLAPAVDPSSTSAGWVPSDPGPLGLAAFGITTFMLSVINADLVGGGAASFAAVFGLMVAVGGLAQIIAGIWEFRTGNTFGALAFTAYGGFWLSFYLLAHSGLGAVPKNEIFSLIGLYLYAWTIFTAIMLLAALRTNAVVAGVFVLLLLTFLFLAIGNSALEGGTAATNGTIKIGGYLGILTSLAAFYGVAAGVVNATWGRTVIPVFPIGS